MNIVPETAPFSREQRAWLNGFLAASLFDRLGSMPLGTPTAGSPLPAAPPRGLWVGYGSQSGSASGLAKKLAKSAESKGFEVTLRQLNRITPDELAAQERLLVVTSTWGDGEPRTTPPRSGPGFRKSRPLGSDPFGTPCSVSGIGTTPISAGPRAASMSACRHWEPDA